MLKKSNKKLFLILGSILILIIIVLFILYFLGFVKLGVVNINSTIKHKVIIDTDTGGDDAAAIMLAAKNENVDIIGITVVAGNVSLKQAGQNALMCLEIMNNDAPVYLGAECALDGIHREAFSVFGTDGMGDAGLIHPKREPEKEDAIEFILETVKNNPGEIELITLGPVTNVAKAIIKDPETMKNVKKIWTMGTAGFGEGNATPVAEFNVYKDVAAFKIMVESGLPITITGLDVISENSLLLLENNLDDHPKNDIDKFLLPAFKKLAEFNYNNTGKYFAMAPDPISIGPVIWDDYINESVKCQASVIDTEGESFGQVIFYRTNQIYESGVKADNPNVELILSINKKYFLH